MPRLPLNFMQVVLLSLSLMLLGCDTSVEETPDEQADSESNLSVHITPPPKPTATIEIEWGEEVRMDQYGFSYRSVSNYNMVPQANGISLIEHDTQSANGPLFFLSNGDYETLAKQKAIQNVLITFAGEDIVTDLLAHTVDDLVPPMNSVIGTPSSITVNGLSGKQVDITLFGEEPVQGRITVLGETPSQLFVMVGLSPLPRWGKEVMPLYNELLTHVTLFDPVASQ